jgi:hypothetical protein
MLSDRFGAFEAIANSSIKLARVAPEEELAMVVLMGARKAVVATESTAQQPIIGPSA